MLAANSNGIVTAHDRPKTSKSTKSAIGRAIDSPLLRSLPKIGSRSCWIAAAPVTYACAPGGRPRALRRSPACFFAFARFNVEITVPYSTWGPAAKSAVPFPVGTAFAARSTTVWSRALTAGSAESGTRKTTMNSPSLRSPKCCSSTFRTCSESVLGTLKTFDCRADSRPKAHPPTTITTSQAIAIGQRKRIAALVQDSIMRGGYCMGTTSEL